jgi:hypothetical protein
MLSPAIDGVYKLDKITSQEYLVSMKSKLNLGSGIKTNPLFGLTMSRTMDSKNKIDKETGLTTESKIAQDMTGNAKITQGTPAMIRDSRMESFWTGVVAICPLDCHFRPAPPNR